MSSDLAGIDVTVDGNVLRITVNRPSRMNAVTTESLDAIGSTLNHYRNDRTIKVAVLTGTGRTFCTGADLSSIEEISDPPSPDTIDAANRSVTEIITFPHPVIGAINGPAAGVGVSLALACDLTVATESSYLLLAFTKIGLMPDGGATALVAASIGRARALRMALLAERLPAVTAADIGLIAATYPDDTFTDSVEALTRQIADGPAHALGATKSAINAATLTEMPDALARERSGQLELISEPDFSEGVQAFREKRPAVFGRATIA
ncbi:enoyl-CoA hydratase [Rhodococcus sp. (in: high G+C Gram-positive bacteria)]|uniref:enoyl-CoA hydratase n=1 Tax=Rhodococcus sp. TaxID=1831 RepID=UPI00257A9DB3|nr:enoyl-CoA hydratase [Rhodococcus sp. (in: high G+C Gram-positive bacteria)]MBQ9052856.1 enoyl-CoA hydratase [Rhodococcus sp. (in: high G+C Gram-positive bacteria)]